MGDCLLLTHLARQSRLRSFKSSPSSGATVHGGGYRLSRIEDTMSLPRNFRGFEGHGRFGVSQCSKETAPMEDDLTVQLTTLVKGGSSLYEPPNAKQCRVT